MVEYAGKCWLPARTHVKTALEALSSVDASCQILRLDVHCPWKEHLYQLEEEMGLKEQGKLVQFCLYKDDKENKWRVQAVSTSASSFQNRRSLASAWWGLRDDKLSEASGIPGCVFCHANGFIGGEGMGTGGRRVLQRLLYVYHIQRKAIIFICSFLGTIPISLQGMPHTRAP